MDDDEAAGRVTASSSPSPYDDIPDPVVIADASGRVIVVNSAAERLVGRPHAELLGLDYREVLVLTDLTGRDWWAATKPYGGLRTRIGQPERRLVLAAGPAAADLREVFVTAKYVRSQGQLIRLVVVLRRTDARERLERSGADLVSTVAHELRSPLTSVKGFTATLLAKWNRFSDEQKRLMLETVNHDADRVTRLITELLDVSRIDSGRLELRRQVVDVPAQVMRIVAGRVASGEPSERFRTGFDDDLPEIWGDPDKLDQVLGNLIENAVRHGAGTVSVEVRRGQSEGIVVTVSDEGEGIPDEVMSRVFTKFWRGTRRGSTGLGLYIVKGIVDAHGGSVQALRGPSGGALFRLSLPNGAPMFPS